MTEAEKIEPVVLVSSQAGDFVFVPNREKYRKIWGLYPEEHLAQREKGEAPKLPNRPIQSRRY